MLLPLLLSETAVHSDFAQVEPLKGAFRTGILTWSKVKDGALNREQRNSCQTHTKPVHHCTMAPEFSFDHKNDSIDLQRTLSYVFEEVVVVAWHAFKVLMKSRSDAAFCCAVTQDAGRLAYSQAGTCSKASEAACGR